MYIYDGWLSVVYDNGLRYYLFICRGLFILWFESYVGFVMLINNKCCEIILFCIIFVEIILVFDGDVGDNVFCDFICLWDYDYWLF